MRFAPILLCCLAALSGCAAKYQIHPDEKTVQTVTKRWAEENDRRLVWDIEDLEFTRIDRLNKRLEDVRSLPLALDVLLGSAEAARRSLERAEGLPWPLPVQTCVYKDAVTVHYLRSAAIPCTAPVPAANARG